MARYRLRLLVAAGAVVLVAAVLTLLLGDLDVFEARTGLFDRLGTWALNALLAIAALLGALAPASLLFPKRWGARASWGGAAFGALIALWFGYVLLKGGV
jgi:hypothetical protein